MIKLLKAYKGFLIGLIIIPIIIILHNIGFILVPDDAYLEVFFVSLFWYLLLALPIHYYRYIKSRLPIIYKLLALFLLFFTTLIIDTKMKMPDNPVTFILLLFFWIGFAYVLVPEFVKKYYKLIAFIYGPLFIYFLYLRLFSGNTEAYLAIKEEFPMYLFFIPIPIFFVLWIIEQWRWLQNLKSEKAQAELALLRQQINPHFFFNTLNNLYALTIKNSKEAPEVILKLSDMMRYTIYEGQNEKVSITDEIAYLNNYIELHKIRFKKKVSIQFATKVNEHLEIAPLLFIILVENAFKHGAERLSENAYIHINLYEEEQYLCFSIKNNFENNEKTNNQGIGLTNLKKRLQLLYPKQHAYSFTINENNYTALLKIKKHV